MSVAIITGANKGIGFETCRALLKTNMFDTVYLTSRNETLGMQAVSDLKHSMKTDLKYHQLDITDPKSISTFCDHIQNSHDGFDVLVQNAGIAYKPTATDEFSIQAHGTLKTNFWGTLNIMKRFYPLIRANGRIVNVSSMLSQNNMLGFTPMSGHPIGRELHSGNVTLTLERLEELAIKFEADTATGIYIKEGWPRAAFGISKLLVNGITRCYGRKAREDGNGVLVNCCCPGFVKTDMTSNISRATKIPERGAKASFWLATLPAGLEGPQGCYIADA